MKLLPILPARELNQRFLDNPLCSGSLQMSLDYYRIIGFNEPWVCYYVEKEGALVGSAAFKGAPTNNMVEIAYGTFEPFQRQGIGTAICKLLVETALQYDPLVIVTARTFMEENASVKLLRKNGFIFNGIVNDPEDGDVWEWLYQKTE